MVNVQTEHLENHIARLTVEVDADRIEQAVRQAARQIARKARIPGFRPGKAPFNVIVNMFGYDYVLSEALDTVGNDIYKEALDASGVEPYAPGALEDVREQGKVLVFTVPKRAKVTLGDYRAIRAEDQPVEVTDEMVTLALEDMRDSEALVEEAQRPAQMGDQVTFGHFAVSVLVDDEDDADDDEDVDDDADEDDADEDDNVDEDDTDDDDDEDDDDDDDAGDGPSERTLIHRHDFQHILYENPKRDLFPGFSPELVGATAGDELDFYMQLPADFADPALAGKTLHVQAEITKVESRIVPEWSDELAKRLSNEASETLLDLRIATRQKLEEAEKQESDQRLAEKALDLLMEGATFQYPEALIDDEVELLESEIENELLKPQGLKLDDYLRIMGQTREQFRAERRPAAVERAKRKLTMSEFVRQEQIDATDAEVDGEIETMISAMGGEERAGRFRAFFNSEPSRLSIGSRLISSRAIERIAQIARGENPPIGVERLQPVAAEAESIPEMPQDAAPQATTDPIADNNND